MEIVGQSALEMRDERLRPCQPRCAALGAGPDHLGEPLS